MVISNVISTNVENFKNCTSLYTAIQFPLSEKQVDEIRKDLMQRNEKITWIYQNSKNEIVREVLNYA